MELQLRQQSVERAYRDHADDVFRVAYAILGNPDAASDATHEAFSRAFERWEQYDTNRPLRPWLHAIAARIALDALRRGRVRGDGVAGGRVAAIQVAGEVPAAVDLATGLASRDLIEGALATLRPAVRAALVLRHYYGYDYAEIAELLQTKPGNVGSMLSRGRAELRDRLEEQGMRGSGSASSSNQPAGGVRRAIP